MKRLFSFTLAAWAASADAAVIVQEPGKISVDGIINGSSGTPFSTSDTLDYLTFEVLSTGAITTTLIADSSRQIWLGRYIGLENEFAYTLNPEGTEYLQYTFTKNGEAPGSFSVELTPGIYVIAMGVRNRHEDDNQIYEIDYGYLPVNPEGGGFTFGTYSYTVEGDIRGLEFRDGELNGTFITTSLVPEPGIASLLAAGSVFAFRRRRKAPVGRN